MFYGRLLEDFSQSQDTGRRKKRLGLNTKAIRMINKNKLIQLLKNSQ